MARTIKFVKAVSGEKPAVRIQFFGKTLNDYFSLRKVAREDFDTTQTELGRLIICDWLKQYRRDKEKGIGRFAYAQMKLSLGGEKD